MLDNLEQVLDASVDVARLLDAAPELRVLATSRAPLRITRERVYAVQPLPVPDLGADTARGIEHVAAVRLYVERVHAADPHFTVTDENAGAIARICRALDGLPLALELAAARVRTLGAEGTAARLGERLSLLSRGARDLPERQRSLRATLDWSIQLLEADALRVIGVLGAFSGGASLDAVEAVARGSDVPSALEDLLDAALVTRTTGANEEPRFGMLETVREYAAELLASSERGVARSATGTSVGSSPWSRARGCTGSGTRIREWLDRIELEHDNYRAALDHASAVGDAQRELRLANALRYFWRVRGYVVEGRRRLEAAVERSDSVEPKLRARTLGEAGIMAFTGGDYERSRELWIEALPLIEEIGEPREIARAYFELGAWAHAQREAARGEATIRGGARGARGGRRPDRGGDGAREPGGRVPGDRGAGPRPRGIRGRARAVRAERRPGRARGDDAQHGVRRARERRPPGGRAPPRGGTRVGGAARSPRGAGVCRRVRARSSHSRSDAPTTPPCCAAPSTRCSR